VVLTNPASTLSWAGTSYNDVLPSLNLTGDLGSGNLVRFEVRSGESSLLRNSHCQQLADALKAALQKLLSPAS